MTLHPLDRRTLLKSAAALTFAPALPAWARSGTTGLSPALATLSGEEIALTVDERHFATGGRSVHAVSVNGSIPAPLIRLREGQRVQIAVTNNLRDVDPLARPDRALPHGRRAGHQFCGHPAAAKPRLRSKKMSHAGEG